MTEIKPGTPLPWGKQEPDEIDAGVGIIGLRVDDDGEPFFTPTNGLVAFACQLPTEIDADDFTRAEANARYIVHTANAYPSLLNGLREARDRFAAIAGFGDPWEITEEPEEFGGTDDGQETVCMVYENMQSIASAALAKLDTLLSQEGQS